ncbi:amino acid ABC transporter ATP-binding protein [Streptococcus merionis]|uniref:amino acid ABC transporter ATP-binding protein n=1 Tax=Streptococcus merionis TaxID=400065 RepID=UPI0026ED169F|nr:amino acid ABC transporter ATP-binding protein [Streptococcus merionis]
MLELRHISKRFGDKRIFDNYSLTIPEGAIVAIVGQSGGGKTTLLRMLAGLESFDSGELIYNGEQLPIEHLEEQNLLGFVFQDFQLFPHLSVMENLTISPIKVMKLPKAEAEEKAQALLQILGLSQHARAYPFSLSGGQKQRVALARAMMISPQMIGFDEPTSALDPELRLEVERLILENKASGITQIVVTHDMTFAENIADQIIKIDPKHL